MGVQALSILYDTEDSKRLLGQEVSAWIKPLSPEYDVAYVHCYTLFNECFIGYSS